MQERGVRNMQKRITIIKKGVGKVPNPMGKCCPGSVGLSKIT